MMKLTLIALALSLSLPAIAHVNSKKCPESFTITYHKIEQAPLSAEIDASWSVKNAWETMLELPVMQKHFQISSRTPSALCVYTSEGSVAAYLQTNAGVDELMIPYNFVSYFRTKVQSFSRKNINLVNDEASTFLLAPILEIDSDGGSIPSGDVKIGQADSVEVIVP